MRVLVTGAGGYIGIPLCEALLKEGHQVLALDRFFFGREKMAILDDYDGLEILQEDTRFLDTEILSDVDCVMDLAGLSNDACGDLSHQLTIDINYHGSIRIAQAAKEHGVKRYIYSSSASVYGAGSKKKLSETDELAPLTQYAKSKRDVERGILPLSAPDFCVTALRNATVYGVAPRMRFDLAVNVMTMRAWKERVIYVMGGGQQWRPFVHVSDVVSAFMLVMTTPQEKVNGEIFNVGSDDQNYRIKQLVGFVLDCVPNVNVHYIPDDNDNRTYNLSFAKIANVLDFRVQKRVPDGVEEVRKALEADLIRHDDPTTFTVHWYKTLIEWEARVSNLKIHGKIL